MIALSSDETEVGLPDTATDAFDEQAGVYLAPAGAFVASRDASIPSLELRQLAAFLTGSPAEAAAIPWRDLRHQDVVAVRAWALEAFADPAARRIMLAARRALSAVVPASAEVLAPGLFRLRLTRITGRGRRLNSRELWRLLEACSEDDTAYGARDAAIIALLVFAGLLPSQVARLSLSDYDDQLKMLRLGKSAPSPVTRIIAIAGPAETALDAWLAMRGAGTGPLFVRLDREDRVGDQAGISATAINAVLRKRASQAAAGSHRPLDLRATYLSALRDEVRQGLFTPRSRFGLGDDGEALLLGASLTIAPPPSRSPQSNDGSDAAWA